MTVLFRLNNSSYQDSIAISFANLKEKLAQHENQIGEETK
jgi:hypothetical protein|tara:strand:+ start:342 stop:461 length:120 start_codon:yes stop_codon:yes gene_type:complete